MCLIVFDWQPGTRHWLTLSANRDEFYKRPTQALAPWPDAPTLYAGKDLEQGGTWLGVTESGHWAALTNVRALGVGPENPRSRGELVFNYLNSNSTPADWLNALAAEEYAPFNLLIGTPNELWYVTNHKYNQDTPPSVHHQRLLAGRYSLSNANLNSPWPKAELALEQLNALTHPTPERLANTLNRREPWPDNQLPTTGVPLMWERLLSAQFILTPEYGTRCSTGLVTNGAELDIQEITWNESGKATKNRSYNIVLKDR